jgi:transposase
MNERIEGLSREFEVVARRDVGRQRLSGIGPIIASATVAAIGTGETFSKGRYFAAWQGFVPKHRTVIDGMGSEN